MENKASENIAGKNNSRRVALALPLLVLLSLFGVWQMGIVFYSSNALSLHGRTPLPVSVENIICIIAAAYAASFITMLFLQRKCAVLGRACASLALLSALGLFLPLPAGALAVFVYVQDFLCVYMIGIVLTVSITVLRIEQTLLYTLLGSIVCGLFIPVMQNDVFSLPFVVFNILTCCILAGLLAVFLRLPADSMVAFAKAGAQKKAPNRLFAGVYVMVFVSCLMTLFGSSLAEGARNGVALYYVSGGAGAAAFLLLWKRAKMNPLRMATAFLMLAGLGFLLFIAAASFPGLRYIACALTGGGLIVCNLLEFFAASLFSERPSRFVLPAIIAIALITVALHALLLELFRDNAAALAVICGGVAVVGAALYLRMEPPLAYAWSKPLAIAAPMSDERREAAPTAPEQGAAAGHDEAFAPLTPQEKALAELILRGYTGKEICESMNISPNTQKDYRKKLYAKLDVHSRSELFELAGRA